MFTLKPNHFVNDVTIQEFVFKNLLLPTLDWVATLAMLTVHATLTCLEAFKENHCYGNFLAA